MLVTKSSMAFVNRNVSSPYNALLMGPKMESAPTQNSMMAVETGWKYKWVENNEPDVFGKTYKWLDICDYLVLRCTGRFVRTADSAFATFLYDTRKGKEGD